tara:strand:- start:18623 stop:19390 length:768 start_codon:yes stop_codon:yes gene_type:complete
MTKIVELIISEDQVDNEDGVFAISLVEEPAIEENWVALKKEKAEKQLIKCAKYDEDKRLLIAPALIPNKQIFRLDEDGKDYYVYFSRDTIKKASELFLKNKNQSNTTLEHASELEDIHVVESWVKDGAVDKSVNYGFEHLPNGTWFVTMKVENDKVWEKVKEGEIKGFSIEGYFTDKIKNFSKQLKETQLAEKIIAVLNTEDELMLKYDWDTCIKDMKKEYGDEETAAKVCSAIKRGTVRQSLVSKIEEILKSES